MGIPLHLISSPDTPKSSDGEFPRVLLRVLVSGSKDFKDDHEHFAERLLTDWIRNIKTRLLRYLIPPPWHAKNMKVTCNGSDATHRNSHGPQKDSFSNYYSIIANVIQLRPSTSVRLLPGIFFLVRYRLV